MISVDTQLREELRAVHDMLTGNISDQAGIQLPGGFAVRKKVFIYIRGIQYTI